MVRNLPLVLASNRLVNPNRAGLHINADAERVSLWSGTEYVVQVSCGEEISDAPRYDLSSGS